MTTRGSQVVSGAWRVSVRAWLDSLPEQTRVEGVTTHMVLEALGLDLAGRNEKLAGRALRELGCRRKRGVWRYSPPGALASTGKGSAPSSAPKPRHEAPDAPVEPDGGDWQTFGRELGRVVEAHRPADAVEHERAARARNSARPLELLARSAAATAAALGRLEGKAP